MRGCLVAMAGVLASGAGVARADDAGGAGGAGGAGEAAGAGGAEPRLLDPVAPAGRARGGRAVGYTHAGQVQLSVRFAVGMRAIATYDRGVYCGDVDAQAASGLAPVCTGRAPFSLDFELGYGVARRVDLVAELRIGIEPDFGASPSADEGPRVLHVAPGARFFFAEGGRSKLFTTAQLVIDASGYEDAAGASRGTDFGVRNLSGLWFDLDPAYGFYFFVGETATFSRWLRLELEGGVGLQGRY